MNKAITTLAFSLIALSPLLATDDFVVNLKDPEYVNGIVQTDKGGVITAPDLRVQAQKLIYTDTKEAHTLIAEGDLMMEHHGKIFVGERLEYDIRNKTGCLIGGRTLEGAWYVGGDRIELSCDGSFTIYGAFVTTSIDRSNPWEIRAKYSKITEGHLLTAKDVRFQIFKFPLLWLPVFKSNLTRIKDPPIRYRILWDKGLGPKLSVRYRFYSNQNFNAFARLDCRIKVGPDGKTPSALKPGGALEADYLSDDKRTLFQTKNYGAYDKTFPNEKGPTRYRFQGIYKTKSKDEYSRFHVQWDKLSDDRMISDFKDSDFEVNTQKTTYLEASHYHDWAFGSLTVRPRINAFQTLNQELPCGTFGLHPFKFGKTGIIMENYASGSNLDYTFINQLDDILKDRRTVRFETINTLYRPVSFGSFNMTPYGGLVAIYYSKSPEREPIGQFLFTYGGNTNIRLAKHYDTIKHLVEPYANYFGYTRPRIPVNDYFVFSIDDGYDQVDQLRFGFRQLFYSKSQALFQPFLTLDLYSYAFWGAKSFDQIIPKAFFDLGINQPAWCFTGNVAWNIQENVLDYGNAKLLWTLSSTFAFGVEYRHRSKFWWRKANYDNYVVDFARNLEDLLASPMSDRRSTFLTQAHIRFTPRWNMQLQTFHGWDRTDEPNYNGARVDFYTMITGNWQIKLTYEYMPNDPYRFSYQFKLIK